MNKKKHITAVLSSLQKTRQAFEGGGSKTSPLPVHCSVAIKSGTISTTNHHFRDSGRRARLVREEDEVAEELTERIGFTMKETKKEDEYHAKVSSGHETLPLSYGFLG